VEALKGVIEQRFPGATLDDHRRWRKQIRTLTGALAFSGLAVIILVTAATIAIIIAAARSAMASNRDIIEVLNFVGAEERFIIRQFERHFLKLGVKAGVVGALAAAAVFFFMPYIADYAAGSAAADAEMRRVVGSGSLDAAGYALLALMVGLIALICQITSRFGVKRILHQQNR
jgi:cell division transport system permease protein